ncbi:MAG: hypothetical protein OHK0013_05740 [Sandaracinaceae bacterium]
MRTLVNARPAGTVQPLLGRSDDVSDADLVVRARGGDGWALEMLNSVEIDALTGTQENESATPSVPEPRLPAESALVGDRVNAAEERGATPTSPSAVRVPRARSALAQLSTDGVAREPAAFGVSVRGLVHVWLGGPTVLGGLGMHVRLGPVGLGGHAAAAPEQGDAMGVVSPTLLAAAAELAIACLDHGHRARDLVHCARHRTLVEGCGQPRRGARA